MVIQNYNMSVSKEWCVYRYANGIKLLQPDEEHYSESLSLERILQADFPVYLEDTNHFSIQSNEATAQACGFESLNDFIGKCPFRNFRENTIYEKLQNHRNVINNNILMIAEESALLDDGQILSTLSIRMPWYSVENKIIGLFGCSIVLGVNSLADSLKNIACFGLLNGTNYSKQIRPNIGSVIDTIYFSRRELDCLELTIKGKPAKQVAYDLKLSQRTVEEYLDNIKAKMKVTSKAAMIEKCIELLYERRR